MTISPRTPVFRRRCLPTTDPDGVHAELGAYMEQVARHHPQLAVAVRWRLLRWSSYQAGPSDAARLFAALVEAAEDVRTHRRTTGPLACAAVAVFGPQSGTEADALLSRPVRIAHHLYASVGIMFGTFAIGPAHPDRWGQVLEAPPVSFVAIRPALPAADLELLAAYGDGVSKAPTATDDGRDVFVPALGVPTSTAAARSGFRRLAARYADTPPLPETRR